MSACAAEGPYRGLPSFWWAAEPKPGALRLGNGGRDPSSLAVEAPGTGVASRSPPIGLRHRGLAPGVPLPITGDRGLNPDPPAERTEVPVAPPAQYVQHHSAVSLADAERKAP